MSMIYETQTEKILEEVIKLAQHEGKLTGFCIGSTRKVSSGGLYFSPIRKTAQLIAGSVIVYKVMQAAEIARLVNGRVQYVFVDAEKNVDQDNHNPEDVGNIERAVREVVTQSTVLTYKGNDLSVDSIDCMLTHLLADPVQGMSGKKVAIIGAGNVGCKLALKLVERGAHVILTRRSREKLNTIVRALNYIKPSETIASVVGMTDNEKAACDADVLVGLTPGTPAITDTMIERLAPNALVIDGGKGSLYPEAIKRAEELGLSIFRLDIRAAFESQVALLLEMKCILENTVGRRQFEGVSLVSGGLLGRTNEVVVDNVHRPTAIYGVADGRGDFLRALTPAELEKLEIVNRILGGHR